MATPEKAGISRTSTSTRPTQGVESLEKTPAKDRKSLTQRLMRSLAVRLALAGVALAGIGYTTTHQEIPNIRQAVGNAIGIVLTENVPDSFDYRDKGVIGNNNINNYSLQQIDDQFPNQIVENGNNLSFLSPFQLPDGTMGSFSKGLSDRLPTSEMQQQAERDGVRDYVDFDLPKGTTIIAPIKGYAYVDMGKQEMGQDPTRAVDLVMVVNDPSNNKTHKIVIYSPDASTQTGDFDLISSDLKLPRGYAQEMLRGTNWKNWAEIQRGQQIMRTTKNQTIRIRVETYLGEEIGPAAALSGKMNVNNLQLFTTTGSSGKEQLLGLQPN